MDMLEYQGRKLIARHGVAGPEGRRPPRSTRPSPRRSDRLPARREARVLIGGPGKAGGIKVAKDRDEARAHAKAIIGMGIRGFTVHEVWIEEASDIAQE